MAYTVKEVTKMSKVSVRTLHYYDEIGLLKPAYHGGNGYRYYEEEQLLRLQQILFFRELDFELKQIKKILSQSDFSKIAALHSHRQRLQKRAERIERLIETIDKTVKHLKGDEKMSNEQLYYGFDSERQKGYEKELKARLGAKSDKYFAQAKERTKNWKSQDWEEYKKEGTEINNQLAKAIDQGLSENSKEVQDLIRKHFQMLHKFYDPEKEMYIELGELYKTHEGFHKFFSHFHPKLSEFLCLAMKHFAESEL